MGVLRSDYEEIYRGRAWAYSDRPDEHLIRALVGKQPGRAVDLGGGQGRHALALAALGYDVVLVDSAAEGLHQATAAAEEKGLKMHTHQSDIVNYVPEGPLSLAVASLLFHIPSKTASKKAAAAVGEALIPGGLFYFSLKGYSKDTIELIDTLIDAAGCKPEWTIKHLVTKKDRPRLGVARRNETRALAVKPH